MRKFFLYLAAVSTFLNSCAMHGYPVYNDPSLSNVDSSAMALVHGRHIVTISDSRGNLINTLETGKHQFYKKYYLTPGRYDINFSYYNYIYMDPHEAIYGYAITDLKAGHEYAVRTHHCWVGCSLFTSRMENNSFDVWFVDITTGEWLGGKRQGMTRSNSE